MIFIFVSFAVSAACLAVYLFLRPRGAGKTAATRAGLTAFIVRLSFFACIFAVPGLAVYSMLTKDSSWSHYAESTVIIAALAAFLMGSMALLQRYGALFFKMTPAMNYSEIFIMMLLPAAMYLSFLPATHMALYYLAPGIYSVYLLRRYMLKKSK